ncbi:hypothetical protein NIES2135_53540 [Leptolyngbya boryana NIES-2135]|jgi:hypothetical protein|uniref:Uncharacterized protein n=1 Tax=Leptolyngbya boryana NIES-2135 TaxID=1973484 RepID=A0A1Z4JNZ3_LEPBY|nr:MULTISPECIES: hypothetical protein [Leptolyngbya]BAY58481.1 hypothetical protein NIES2135_53540 [Leptolyngbya boryana NIES-2135]MBD2370955.1 hypothetical protein [Leptolyngbya sp. FACHB-161]MBD2377469.1 hypothetical protein [Leptolyngbya sp. FACHB-238]MBD2401877.1 hypothetical protein [Leptolyngbya sp. FACHB-239]MBD2408395.1 hypothetical protein [Leptolyngbya sp. FACHB-402]
MTIRNFEAKGFFTDNPVIGPGSTPTQKALIDLPIISTTISKEVEETEVEGTVDGTCEVQILDTIITRSTWNVSFEVQKLRSDAIALLMGETWAAAPNSKISNFKMTSVPVIGDPEITDTKLVDAEVDDVKVSVYAGGTWGLPRYLEVVTTGTPTVNQVLLDDTAGTLTFNAGLAGAPIKYSVDEIVASGLESLGIADSPRRLNNLLFRGVLCSTEPEIVMVEMDLSPSGGFELPIGGDPGVTLEYRAVVKGANRSPVRMFRKAA